MITSLAAHWRNLFHRLSFIEGIAPLLMRLYLAPVMMQAGWTKFQSFDSTVAWFGNADWGLGLPFP
ncbi:MAG: DoxX family membrane protein [Thalassolituus sp.]